MNNIPNSSQKDPLKCEHVSRETQPRSESEKMLAFFHLLTEECRTMV